MGADGVELDVRRTADGALVVHHDPEVEGFGLIAAQPFAIVRAQHPEIPTLGEALETCAGMIVNVEIKCLPWEPDPDTPDHEVVRAVAELLRAGASVPVADVIVSSFDLSAVDACRAFAPELATGWLTSNQEVVDRDGGRSRARSRVAEPGSRRRAACVGRDRRCRGTTAGLRVNVWTVDDRDDMTRLAAMGVDAIITNVPDVAIDVFKPRSRAEGGTPGGANGGGSKGRRR